MSTEAAVVMAGAVGLMISTVVLVAKACSRYAMGWVG